MDEDHTKLLNEDVIVSDESDDSENEDSVTTNDSRSNEKCVLQCQKCQPLKVFDDICSFERHIKVEHSLASVKKYSAHQNTSPFRELAITECQICQRVIINDRKIIDKHLHEAHATSIQDYRSRYP